MDSNFDVVLLGVDASATPPGSPESLARTFGIDVGQAARWLDRIPTTVKREAPRAVAEKYGRALAAAGMRYELRVARADRPAPRPERNVTRRDNGGANTVLFSHDPHEDERAPARPAQPSAPFRLRDSGDHVAASPRPRRRISGASPGARSAQADDLFSLPDSGRARPSSGSRPVAAGAGVWGNDSGFDDDPFGDPLGDVSSGRSPDSGARPSVAGGAQRRGKNVTAQLSVRSGTDLTAKAGALGAAQDDHDPLMYFSPDEGIDSSGRVTGRHQAIDGPTKEVKVQGAVPSFRDLDEDALDFADEDFATRHRNRQSSAGFEKAATVGHTGAHAAVSDSSELSPARPMSRGAGVRPQRAGMTNTLSAGYQPKEAKPFFSIVGDAFLMPLRGPGIWWVALTSFVMIFGMLGAGVLSLLFAPIGLAVMVMIISTLLALCAKFFLSCMTHAVIGENEPGAVPDLSALGAEYTFPGFSLLLFAAVSNAATIAFIASQAGPKSGPIYYVTSSLLSLLPYFYWPIGLALIGVQGSFMSIWNVHHGFGAILKVPLKYSFLVVVGIIAGILPVVVAVVMSMGNPGLLRGLLATFIASAPLAYSHGVMGAMMGALLNEHRDLIPENG